MLLSTRRRALGLLFAAGATLRPSFVPHALAQAKKDCFDSKAFGPWKAQASDAQAGARINEVRFNEPCDLRVEVQVAASFEGKIVVYGDPEKTPLPKRFLIKPENRLIVRTEGGKVAVDEPLCGNCTDIFDDKVSIILPLACAPLFREEKSIEMAVKLVDKADCRFKLNCETLRAGLAWASERQKALAALLAEERCTPPEGCFITTACCEVLGLDDDCFELRTLRRYRDDVLADEPGGAADITAYYELAPLILARLPKEARKARLRAVYARYILPAALAAHLGLNALAYRLYRLMLGTLATEFVPERQKDQGRGVSPRPRKRISTTRQA
jgi:hypothetical protein